MSRQHRFRDFISSWLPKTPFEPCSSCATDIGKREENQDRCYCNDRNAVYLVVDGMGGHRGGALASQIAVETIPKEIAKSFGESTFDSSQAEQLLQRAIEKAIHEMEGVSHHCPDYRKMGCTLAIAVVVGDRLLYTHIGDARVYLFHQGKVKQLTKDESLVQELVDVGAISESLAPTHHWRHIVTNCLSANGLKKRPHWHELKLTVGDEVLLTTDGLTDVVSNEVIEQTVCGSESSDITVTRLVDEALRRDANDNVTCVVTKLLPLTGNSRSQAQANKDTSPSHRAVCTLGQAAAQSS